MIEPRGTGTLYQLEMMRLFGLVRPDDIVSVADIFGRPELWALHQGSLWVQAAAGPGAGGVGFRSRVGVALPSNTRNVLSVVERVRLHGTATQAVQFAIAVSDASALTNLNHRDVRRANAGIAGLQGGISTRGLAVNGTAIPSPTVVTETVRIPANDTLDVQVEYVLEPGASFLVMAAADNTALGMDVVILGRERAATDDEIQM